MPPPPDSRRLSVLKHIQTTIRSMNVAGGYHWDVSEKTDRVTLDPVNILTGYADCSVHPAFQIEATPEGEITYHPASQMRDAFTVSILCRADAIGSGVDRKTVVAEKIARDVEKVLAVDVTRGGYAVDTRLRHPQTFPEAGATSQIVIVLIVAECVLFRTYGQP